MVEHLHKLPEKGEKEIMFDLFVYGTLKRGGCNHNFLGKRILKPKGEEAEFLRHETLKDHSIYLPHGFNFPIMLPDRGEKVYGEVYRIDSERMKYIDMLEQEGIFYNRIDDSKLGYNYYLWNDERDTLYTPDDKVESGYWATERPVKHNVIIDNRPYNDYADKLVFHMRFFDGKRAPTNKIYMDLVKRRSHLELNTEDEEIFIRDCIMKGVISEVR